MAYQVTNTSTHPVVLSTGAVLSPGETRPFTEVGSKELDLQRNGYLTIVRDSTPDTNKDDARYVEVINSADFITDSVRPPNVVVLNISLPVANTWYLVSSRISKIMGWKMQVRRSDVLVPYDYKYGSDPLAPYMTCSAGEAILGDVDFPALYVRCPLDADQTLEFEYWTKA